MAAQKKAKVVATALEAAKKQSGGTITTVDTTDLDAYLVNDESGLQDTLPEEGNLDTLIALGVTPWAAKSPIRRVW
jgi:hypothetical protein